MGIMSKFSIRFSKAFMTPLEHFPESVVLFCSDKILFVSLKNFKIPNYQMFFYTKDGIKLYEITSWESFEVINSHFA